MTSRPRRDRRLPALAFTAVAVLGGGLWLDRPAAPTLATSAAPAVKSAGQRAGPAGPHDTEIRRRFDQAVVMLHAKQYAHAATALHRLLAIAPTMPEAHVNMGYALLGLQRPKAARDFFDSATVLQPDQANAYYGLALAWEASGDLAMATGAMRSYLHLARDERPEHLRRARAALWEWEQAREAPAPASAPAALPASRPHR
jgi:tetratricopeptide (TPR) repeat protein